MDVTPDAPFPAFCCPLCKGELDARPDAYRCPACDREYPVVLGIPDFRVFPDPWIPIEEDWQKGSFLAANAPGLDFEALVRFYWAVTPNVPDESVERFVRHAVALAEKWDAGLPDLEAALPEPPETVLDLGCGTAGFALAAARRGRRVVGVDLAFRWLVVAKKRLDEAGVSVPLVCACAEHLPFRDAQFDLVFGEALVEHLRDQRAALREARRVGTASGALVLRTTNRFSLAPEPHVGVWGVGFLPRRWMPGYVRLVKGVAYPFLRIVSRGELRRMLRRAGFARPRFRLPAITAAEAAHLPRGGRAALAVYDRLRRLRPVAAALGGVFPILEVQSAGGGPEAGAPASGERR